jgi:chitosanase
MKRDELTLLTRCVKLVPVFYFSLSSNRIAFSVLATLGFALTANVSFAEALTAKQLSRTERHKIEEISSIFENGTPTFQYAYIQDIGDGAGITAGRLGFNTSAGDLLEVVQKYSALKSGHTPLAKYIPCLQASLNTSGYACLFPSVDAKTLDSDDFKNTTLVNDDFGRDWTAAAADPVMIGVQDGEVIENVYDAADEWATKLGIETAFGYAVLFDTVLQMGGDDTTNSLGGIARRTEASFAKMHPGLTDPGHGANEADWLGAYLLQRRETLRFGFNDKDVENSTEVPYQSYPRVDSLLQMLAEKNPNLSASIHFSYFGNNFTLNE